MVVRRRASKVQGRVPQVWKGLQGLTQMDGWYKDSLADLAEGMLLTEETREAQDTRS